ncbi:MULTISPECIES: DDE-type integrase/transposase/recombinase [unclassified Serratia (in: enterobacteria)]|uniref:DDE-type integrase/transposase/recombinase n=1 Tax=unclassified Serratia (in: enterobacteria) TaxID=2647522 RepID=UPI000507FA4A|nr:MULTISPECIES: DDE-type integrase/transposase/recombinase [unclassified Serratia (in: enterobacteria)]KFK92779.1 integrase [Serratia sp. Ag2]KFK98553.1 integrase [Serratia sp. Ag1]
MNAILNERLVEIAKEARMAPHGAKEAIYQAACEELQISKSTLLKKLKTVAYTKPRKKRSDAGKSIISEAEVKTIAAAIKGSTRMTSKRLYSIEQATDDCRRNGMVQAGQVDQATGEFTPVHKDTVRRALLKHRLHPTQMKIAAPHVRLVSRHPNHVWQLDASICVLFYLKNPKKISKAIRLGQSNLYMMPEAEFNKNKPDNLDRIAKDRVWSFEITDHTSGWIYVEYQFGGETSANFASVLINAMQEREGADILHGVPEILFTDPGSALKAPTLGNLCKSLGVRMIPHKARNARATGSVEKARDIIERQFEGRLSFQQVNDLDDLNDKARAWRMLFNRKNIHSRHGETRTAKWLAGIRGHLVKAPPLDVCRELAVSTPESRKVRGDMSVPFKGKSYNLRPLVEQDLVCVGESVLITVVPLKENVARVVLHDDNGMECFYQVDEIMLDENGFPIDAPVIGESFAPVPQTLLERNKAELDQLLTETTSAADAQAALKARTLPFGGRLNPFKDIEEDIAPTYLPVRGEASKVRGPRIEQFLNPVEVVRTLREQFKQQGKTWNSTFYTDITTRFPDGVPADQVEALAAEYMALTSEVVVRLVNSK